MRRKLLLFCVVLCALLNQKTMAQSFTENFDNITTLAASGWVQQNNSVAVGSTSWFQATGIAGGGPFDAYNGAATSYIGANYNNTGSTGTISNWLMTPNRTFKNGDVLTFYTRKPSPDSYADRLEVRMSTNGTSTSAGSGSTVGDFSTLLLSINPNLVLGVYPTAWTLYTITISGLPAPTSGRIAFRYFVTGAGISGSNSDFIGIDAVNYLPYVCPTITLTSGGALTSGTAGTVYSNTLTQTGCLGTPNFVVTAGALAPGLTISSTGTISGTPTATGTFNFTVTANDASGCSGSQSYSITVVCPSDPIVFSAFPAICSNDNDYTLMEASPAGGLYSGTGVSSGIFDPSAGTQTIDYLYTDPYGCAFSQSSTINVNTSPVVSQTSFSSVCSNIGLVSLSGGLPAGGVYSGTGVTGTDFDVNSGTQLLTYTYTDANGCSTSASETIVVNTAPTVTLGLPVTEMCANWTSSTLSGGMPTGGTYSGSGVSSGEFNPATAVVGNNIVSYTYMDGNGCSNIATESIFVNSCAGVEEGTNESIAIFPNPSTGIVNLMAHSKGQITRIQLFDLGGKEMKITAQYENENVVLDISSCPSGEYLLKALVNNETIETKLIKK